MEKKRLESLGVLSSYALKLFNKYLKESKEMYSFGGDYDYGRKSREEH